MDQDGDRDPRLEELARIKQAFEVDPEGFVNQTENLTDADVSMIGKVIQLYCYADFNGRRIIDAIRHAALGAGHRNGARLQDAQVFPYLREIVNEYLWDSPLKDGLLAAATIVEMHRIHRHNFAHWAARRLKGIDALVMFSKNAREAERRDGVAQQADEAKYGILPLAGFDREVHKLQDHGNYLANQAAHLERHVEEFREELAKRRAH